MYHNVLIIYINNNSISGDKVVCQSISKYGQGLLLYIKVHLQLQKVQNKAMIGVLQKQYEVGNEASRHYTSWKMLHYEFIDKDDDLIDVTIHISNTQIWWTSWIILGGSLA